MNWKIGTNASTSGMAFMITLLVLTSASIAQITAYLNPEAYAKEYSQNTSQSDHCGNGSLSLNVICSNQGSGIQGDENVVSTASDQFSQTGTAHQSIQPEIKSISPSTDLSVDTVVEDNNNDGNEDGLRNESTPIINSDPTLLVLPCCDEMSSDIRAGSN